MQIYRDTVASRLANLVVRGSDKALECQRIAYDNSHFAARSAPIYRRHRPGRQFTQPDAEAAPQPAPVVAPRAAALPATGAEDSKALGLTGLILVLAGGANVLKDPTIRAWRAKAGGNRYIHVFASSRHHPIHGQVTAILKAEDNRAFWDTLFGGKDLPAGDDRLLTKAELSQAWTEMPIVPPDTNPPTPPDRKEPDAA